MDQSTFTSKEIGFLLQRAQTGQPEGIVPDTAGKVEAFDFRGAGHLSSSQITRLVDLHVKFAERFALALSGLLSLECKAAAGSVEQMPFGELVKQLPEGAVFGMLRVHSPESNVFLQTDLATTLPAVDLLLGGAGTATDAVRPLSEIEQEIFRPAIGVFAAELQALWAPFLETSVRFEHYGPAANLLPVTDRVLGIRFEIQIGELRGTWTLILPPLASNFFIRKIEQQISIAENEGSEQAQRRLRERLMDSRFRLELFLPPSTVSVRKLARLQNGHVIVLKPRASDPVDVNVAGINMFQAAPVSCGTHRGAQIKKTLSTMERAEEETQ